MSSFKKNKGGFRPEMALLFLEFAVAILGACATNLLSEPYKFSVPEQFLLAIQLFATLLLINAIVLIRKHYSMKVRRLLEWSMRSNADNYLLAIRGSFDKLSKQATGEKDLYYMFFVSRIQELHRSIVDAAERQELAVGNHAFYEPESVLAACDQGNTHSFRFVWPVDIAALFVGDPNWTNYFLLLSDLVNNKRLEVQTVFINRDLSVPQGSAFSMLLNLYSSKSPRMSCKIVTRDAYSAALKQYSVGGEYVDFGIYGDSLLFLTEGYSEGRGKFSRDLGIVRSFDSCFSALWNVGKPGGSHGTIEIDIFSIVELEERSLAVNPTGDRSKFPLPSPAIADVNTSSNAGSTSSNLR